MRRPLIALLLALASLGLVAPGATALPVAADDEDHICIRSKLLLGDNPICVTYTPPATSQQ
jgi:hypothetical protein